MRLSEFIVTISSVVKRLAFTRCRSHRQLFIDLSPVLISAQDHGLPSSAALLLSPYQTLIRNYVTALARAREALPGSSGRFLRLPLGCRLGKLHFSPLLQLAKLSGHCEITAVDFETLPRTSTAIGLLVRRRIALGEHAGEPATFKTVLGFSLKAYCAFLAALRQSDPVLFVLLMANEFSYARDWAAGHRPADLCWVERAATLGELERLVEIASFAKTHPSSVASLKKALKGVARRPAPKKRLSNSRQQQQLRRHVEQLGYGAEALRALFLGDAAGPPIASEARWSSTTPEARFKAAARSAWFAKDKPVEVPGFRPSKRFVRSQRISAYTYYGIPLDCLLPVGIKDLATALGRPGGIHAVDALASEIHGGLFGPMVDFDRLARQASLYSEIYLRGQGHGGSGNRFNPRCWFENSRDEALYGRLWRVFAGPANAASASSVRDQIRSSICLLRELIEPFWANQVPGNAAEAAGAVAQLTFGLTPISMDPVFAALLERALMERNVPVNFRSDPSREAAKQGGFHREAYLNRFLSRSLRAAYSRFEGMDGRLNHQRLTCHADPLVRTKTLPGPLLRAAI
ncbi:MAG TPA: hypothetical protein VF628_13240 [Allosphingosinicella sp.]|jgi:hypothetical protein